MVKMIYSWAERKARDWKNYLPPARPSESELALMESYFLKKIKEKHGKRVRLAILGCTVEYRSLAHKYGMDVTLIELSKLHHKIISEQHMHYKGLEKVIWCDWRHLKTNKKFDIVLGDVTLNLMNHQDRDRMLENISMVLDKNGLFMPRDYVTIGKMPKDMEAITKIARKKFPNVHFYTSTAAYAYPAYTNKKTEFTDIPKFKESLNRLMKRKLISKAECRYYMDRLRREKLGVAVPSLTSLNNQMKKYFRLIKIESGIDVFSDYLKIHILGKKRILN